MEEDDIVAGWSDAIRHATETSTPLRIRGGGTKDWYGQTLRGRDSRYARASRHHRVRPGRARHHREGGHAARASRSGAAPNATRCCLRAAALRARRDHRRLHRGGHRRPAPRRRPARARDFVLGAVVMNGQGQVLHFGGQVVKNVAGYDVSRLIAGSLGTLGLILELSVKVLPRPVAEATLKFEMNATDGVRKLNEWGGHPLPITGSAWRDGTLAVAARGRGSRRESGAHGARRRSRRCRRSRALLDRPARTNRPVFRDIPPKAALWRLALPSIAEPLQLPGAQLMEWGGAQRWWITDTDPQTVRISAKQAGGHATIFRSGAAYDRNAGVFTPLPAPADEDPSRPESRLRSRAHLQSRPPLSRLLSQANSDANQPRRLHSRHAPMATKPTPSCASACTAVSARRPARPTKYSATNSTARAGASI